MQTALFLIRILPIAALLAACQPQASVDKPVAKAGVLDLRAYDQSRPEIIPLKGQWAFYWKQFIDPSGPATGEQWLRVPAGWRAFTGGSILLPRQFGYASYRLRILLPDSRQVWALHLPPIRTAYRVFVNGKLLAQGGEPRTDATDTPTSASRLVHFTTVQPVADVVLHVSNHHFVAGGIWTPPQLAPPQVLERHLLVRMLVTVAVATLLFIIGLYHLLLFALRRQEKAFLYFGLVALLAGLRQLYDGQNLFFTIFEHISWFFTIKLLHLLFPIGTILFVRYLCELFPAQRSRRIEQVLLAINIFVFLFILSTPPAFYTRFIPWIALLSLVQFSYLLLLALKAWRANVRGAGLIFLTSLLLGFCVVYDIVLIYLQIFQPFLVSVGVALFALCQAWLLARRFVYSIRQTETLVTRLQTAAEEVSSLNQKQQETEQQKALQEIRNRFLSNITHEFRTPLSLIMAPADELMADPATSPDQQNLVQTIRRSARQLLHLVNQSLDLAKLDANHMTRQERPGDLILFIAEIITSFRVMAAQQQVELTFTRNIEPLELMIDADKLEKIIGNLLSNALKYTPPHGKVGVDLWSSPIENGIRTVNISVHNTGDGIPPDSLPHIFERFYQADSSGQPNPMGTGIGLALVKELTEFLGGQVSVSSEAGQGTTFCFSCPMRLPGEEPTPEPPEIPAVVADNATPRANEELILVVEDNDMLRDLTARQMARQYRVLTAANGREGWEVCEKELPDLVISDVMMPGLDGYDLCRLIKQSPATQHIAVMLLTARSGQESRLRGLECGANDYLAKPFDHRELALRVSNLLQHQQRQRERYYQELLPSKTGPVAEQSGPQTQFFSQVQQALAADASNPGFGVEQLAQTLAVSSKTLNRRLTSLAGVTANELIRTHRLRQATDLLRTGHSVSDAAYLSGFESPAYFSRCFKEEFAVSPSDFVRNHSLTD